MRLAHLGSLALLGMFSFGSSSSAAPGGTVDYSRYGPWHVLTVAGSTKTGAFTVQAIRPNGTSRNTGQTGSGIGSHSYFNSSGSAVGGIPRGGEKVQITWLSNGSTITSVAPLAAANNVSNVFVASFDPGTPNTFVNVGFTLAQDALAPDVIGIGYWPEQQITVTLPNHFIWAGLPFINSTDDLDVDFGTASFVSPQAIQFDVQTNNQINSLNGFTLSLGTVLYDGFAQPDDDFLIDVTTTYDVDGSIFESHHDISAFVLIPEPASAWVLVIAAGASLIRRRR